jgi:hypothetical protein
MKKSSASIYSPTLEMPHITKTFPRNFKNRKPQQEADQLPVVPPPTEEMINHLNRIGSEYPFCVYYKHRTHDPL